MKTFIIHTVPQQVKSLQNMYFVLENANFRFMSKKAVIPVLYPDSGINGCQTVEYACGRLLPIFGDVRILLYNTTLFWKGKNFYNSGSIRNFLKPGGEEGLGSANTSKLVLKKFEIEKPHKDKKHKLFKKDIAVECRFEVNEEFDAEVHNVNELKRKQKPDPQIKQLFATQIVTRTP
eukprot:TRINITY_DN5720_c0_g1_i2.p1 TRINITY_DN5720_c0_g1~~TRINITY_DN5720_c0_g1_i2.p1  ORF type:complete len:177 (-),score=30.41 TRINITY_DN5720_c0_g1_i2:258-788(-)